MPEKWFCGRCGYLNHSWDAFCGGCGVAREEGATFQRERDSAAAKDRVVDAPTAGGPDTAGGAILVGIALIIVGLLISFVTYAAASSSPSGGFYLVAYGPVIAGVALLVRGLLGSSGQGLAPRLRR